MKRPNPDPSSENTQETAPCFACGQQTPLPDDVHSPVCYRPLCEDCAGDSGPD